MDYQGFATVPAYYALMGGIGSEATATRDLVIAGRP
jgi:hypothetical protein